MINVPIGIAAIIYAQMVLPKDAPSPSESFDFVGMALLSPGLAAFLFGVSSIPEAGTFFAPRPLVATIIGILLIVAFVFHAFRPEHPLLDLRLFKNFRLTISIIAMFMFITAFMGAGLLFPSYFLQVRGESTLMAGLLIAPQGIGAMITMPIAGALTDKLPVGRIVPFGLVLIAIGFGVFTQVEADTSYMVLMSALFVMGLGMGATMMPIMTASLKSLTSHEVARGSTLLNIVQQIGSSVGAALMSVVLTNEIQKSDAAGSAIASNFDPSVADNFSPAYLAQGFIDAAAAFATTFWVALVLILLTFVPVYFLPRKHEESRLLDDDTGVAPPVMMH
ncbi:hypothetical protein BH09ACT10_BH09ACT10_21870 [soil metagenome]